MEKTGNNTYRIAISAVPGDLQDASCYVITVTVGSAVMRGDVDGNQSVDIGDVTALIDYLLSGNSDNIDLVAADMDENTDVNISDVTALVDYLLSGN
jgi:pectinesterase